MKTLIAFGILLLISFVGAVKLFSRFKVTSPLAYLSYSGTAFIFFGLLVGQNGLNLISSEITHHLQPVIHFSLGWVGFIFGFQLEWKFFKRIRQQWYWTLVATYFITFGAIFALGFFWFRYLFVEISPNVDILAGFSMVLAILVSDSSVSFAVWSSKFFRDHSEKIRLCTFIASMDNLFPILFTGVVFSLYRYLPGTSNIIVNPLGSFGLSFGSQLLLGGVMGTAVYFLLKRLEEKLEMSAILFGSVFFISGVSLMFKLSPLFTGMVMGAVYSNLTKRHTPVLKILSRTEKPIYLIFLLYLSIKQAVFSFDLLAVALLMLLVKFLSRMGTFQAINGVSEHKLGPPLYYSYMLLPISSIAPAILLDLAIAFPHPNMAILSGVFITALVISEILGPAMIRMARKRLD